MKTLKIIILSLIIISLFSNSKTPEDKQVCMEIKHSENVSVCLMDMTKEKNTYK